MSSVSIDKIIVMVQECLVCAVSLSDGKDKIDLSHTLHTNNVFLTNNSHHQNEKVRKKQVT